MYVINRRLKSRLSPTLTPAISNNLPTAELPSINVTAHPINVTAPPTNVTAPPINVTAPSIDVTAPSPTNVTAPPTNATAPSIKAIAAVNYGRDLVTLVKIYTEESKYSGEDNNFNCKLIIFNNLYNRVGIL